MPAAARHEALRERVFAVLAVACSVAFYVLPMHEAGAAFLAWVWAVPMALWAAKRPRWRAWLLGAAVCAWAGGALTLIWLRNLYPPLGWLAELLLPLAYSAFPFAWLVFLRLIFPATSAEKPFPSRLLNLLGLAGLWILLEWMLTWVLSGFPWMPLGATQWQRPSMLAFCPFAGTAGASFLLIFFNLCAARYLRQLTAESRSLRGLCPEFYCALALIVLSVFAYWAACLDFARRSEKYFSFAAVQTDFDPQEKWDEQRVPASVVTLEKLTLEAASSAVPAPDFILWPEAALPFSVSSEGYAEWVSGVVRRAGVPLVFGGIFPAKNGENPASAGYYNSAHIAYPKTGVAREFYAKRHLVPFGEYMPLGSILPLRKIVPMVADCATGTSAEPLRLFLSKKSWAMGVLICYEDVFPELGRELVAHGAEFLAVLTNDAWYGRESGAYQHAAHSVMQAVSLGVPVIRCGNAGWSGVVDPLGHTQAMTTDDGSALGTIYFRGQRRFDVWGWKLSPRGNDASFPGETVPVATRRGNAEGNATAGTPALSEPIQRSFGQTFYARHGDWFVSLGGFLFLAAYLRNRRWKKRSRVPATPPQD